MIIMQEGQIRITPDSKVFVTGFEVEGTPAELKEEVERRVLLAADYIRAERGELTHVIPANVH